MQLSDAELLYLRERMREMMAEFERDFGIDTAAFIRLATAVAKSSQGKDRE